MKFFIIFGIVIIGLIVGLSIYLQPNSFLGCGTVPTEAQGCQKADAIVVVSGGDTIARTQAGIQLYQNNWAATLILSGAALDKSGPSNAEAMKRQALAAGVPEENILIDEDASNTQQNAANSQSIFARNNFENVILVTSGYHQRRASLEFNKQTDNVTIRNYPVINDKDWSWFWWLTPRGWWLAGGEVAKIIAFHFGVSS